jgi:hypothetical protein
MSDIHLIQDAQNLFVTQLHAFGGIIRTVVGKWRCIDCLKVETLFGKQGIYQGKLIIDLIVRICIKYNA